MNIDPNPYKQFAKWYKRAQASSIDKPNGMSLSTVNAEGRVSSRIVLLSRFSEEEGFVFHTNYLSRKGHDLKANPYAALLFWWDEIGYQIRIEGNVEQTSAEKSDKYFLKRPRGSQLGAWASEQSQVIESRNLLETRLAKFTQEFENTRDVPRPPHWGGYALKPVMLEFWLNRKDRMHDRVVYQRQESGWSNLLLAP